VPWDGEQLVRRVIVEVSRETGQPVRVVAGEAFAMTLWTWAELRLMDREASIMRMGERTDMAGQMAMAFHQPHDLQKMEMRYLKAAGQLSQMFEHTKARLMHVAQAAAQAKPTPEA